MDNNIYEQEIDLKDLMFAVFRRWRTIIIFASIFTILFGGYKCVKELINQNNEVYVAELKKQYNTDQEKYEKYKKAYEQDIDSINASVTNQEEYKKNSVLLKIDPYDKGTASVDIFVKMVEVTESAGITVTSVDFADSVVKAYASAIQQGDFLEDISKKMGIKLIYLKELVTITTDYDSNMLNVSVSYTDKESAGEILDVILDHLKYMYPEIQKNLGKHNLSIMNQDIGFVTDPKLVDYQKKKVEDLANTNKNLEDTEKALKELQKPEKPVALSKMAIFKEGVKYGSLGCIAGVFLATFYVCVIFLMNGKLNTDEGVKNYFGLKHLGSFAYIRKKKMLSGVDMWLDRLEGRESISDDSVYDIISANILGMSNKGNSVFLTGMVEEYRLSNLVEELQKRLPELKLGFGNDIVHCAATLRNLQQYDTIILVEARIQSKIREIEKEIETVRNMERGILGYIVMDPCKTVK